MTRCDTDCSVARVCAYFVREWFYQAIDSVNWRHSNTSGEHVEKKGRHINTAPRDTLEEVDGEQDEKHNVQGYVPLMWHHPEICKMWHCDSRTRRTFWPWGTWGEIRHEALWRLFSAFFGVTRVSSGCSSVRNGRRWTIHSRHKIQQNYEINEMHRLIITIREKKSLKKQAKLWSVG